LSGRGKCPGGNMSEGRMSRGKCPTLPAAACFSSDRRTNRQTDKQTDNAVA